MYAFGLFTCVTCSVEGGSIEAEYVGECVSWRMVVTFPRLLQLCKCIPGVYSHVLHEAWEVTILRQNALVSV